MYVYVLVFEYVPTHMYAGVRERGREKERQRVQ